MEDQTQQFSTREIFYNALKSLPDQANINSNLAIRMASRYGHLDVVKDILKDPMVDPSSNGNYAIVWAARNGHLEIVRELMKDPRVDPSSNNEYAIKWAFFNGHFEIVEELKKKDRSFTLHAPKRDYSEIICLLKASNIMKRDRPTKIQKI